MHIDTWKKANDLKEQSRRLTGIKTFDIGQVLNLEPISEPLRSRLTERVNTFKKEWAAEVDSLVRIVELEFDNLY